MTDVLIGTATLVGASCDPTTSAGPALSFGFVFSGSAGVNPGSATLRALGTSQKRGRLVARWEPVAGGRAEKMPAGA